MRFVDPSQTAVGPCSEKDSQRQSFVAEGLAAQTAAGFAPLCVSMVARSLASPIVSAVTRAIASHDGNVSLRVIVMETGTLSAGETDVNAEFRILNDARFGSAHEQVVAGDGHVWIGDCMRRDPTKRDAFEMMHSGEAAVLSHAARSFERLWNVAKPVKVVAGIAPELLAAGAECETAGFGERR